MGKLGGTALLVALGISLAACSAPTAADPTADETRSANITQATPTVGPITAAPQDLEARQSGTDSPDGAAGDADFLSGVKEKWRGELPEDSALISAGKFACDEFAAGKMYDEMRPVAGETADDRNNGIRVAVFAGRIYCPEFNPDKL